MSCQVIGVTSGTVAHNFISCIRVQIKFSNFNYLGLCTRVYVTVQKEMFFQRLQRKSVPNLLLTQRVNAYYCITFPVFLQLQNNTVHQVQYAFIITFKLGDITISTVILRLRRIILYTLSKI